MNAVMDWDRERRTGLAEAVYATGKPLSCLVDLLEKAAGEKRRLLVTRLSAEAFAAFPARLTGIVNYDALSKTAILGEILPTPKVRVAVISAGMADSSVAQEVSRTLAFAGVGSRQIVDVGVAGLWRLMARLEEIRTYSVVVVVAGMEGALFSVIAGLISAPIIAVPTSTGYGVSSGGQLALHSALGSCAPGVVVVNIDNGFGAAQAALRIVNSLQQTEAASPGLSSIAVQSDTCSRAQEALHKSEVSCASS
jgi:NCAIR mutase (PurE)-related protein